MGNLTGANNLNGLLPLLQRLDQLLEVAIAAAQIAYGAAPDPHRGLHIGFELNEFDLDVLAIAIAPQQTFAPQ